MHEILKFDPPLVLGRLVKRYKRFLADVELDTGEVVTAHCANPGSMRGLLPEGARVALSPNTNPKAKLAWRWEMVQVDDTFVGIHTNRANDLVYRVLLDGLLSYLLGDSLIAPLTAQQIDREVVHKPGSRIDFVLRASADDPSPLYLEVKSVTLKEQGIAQFPDSVTARGKKHLEELSDIAQKGGRAAMLFIVQRDDVDAFKPAAHIDKAYANAFQKAKSLGVSMYAFKCKVTPAAIHFSETLPILSDSD